jgi:hypothetical protein
VRSDVFLLEAGERDLGKITTESKQHVMISYNRDNREICLKIKKELEGLGHLVWIDVENRKIFLFIYLFNSHKK